MGLLPERISILIRRDTRGLPCSRFSFSIYLHLHVGIQQEAATYKPGRKPSFDTKLPGTLILGFPAFRSMKNKFLFLEQLGLWYSVIIVWADWYTTPWIPPLTSFISTVKRPQLRQLFCGKTSLSDPSVNGTQLCSQSITCYHDSLIQYYHIMFHMWISQWTRHHEAKEPNTVQTQNFAHVWCSHVSVDTLLYWFDCLKGRLFSPLSFLAMKYLYRKIWKYTEGMTKLITTLREVSWFIREWSSIPFINICETKTK